MSTQSNRRRRVAGIMLMPVAALVIGACAPKPAPPPPAPPPPPPTVSCTVGGTLSDAVEQCHLKYKAYSLDTANVSAQDKADSLIDMTPSQCSSSLGAFHTPGSTLIAQYPGSSAVAENLQCQYFSNGNCSGATFGATTAMNKWLASAGHKANLDNFAGKSVNAAAACRSVANGGTGVYIAVAQFHSP